MKKTFLALGAATLGLAGCETIVDVDAPAHTPRLSLSYTLSNQPVTADYRKFFDSRDLYVSTSQSVLATKPLAGRADATVEVLDAGGQVVERFRPKARAGYPDSLRGYYVPTRGYVGQPGRTYQLRASAPGVETAEATLTLPAPATIDAATYVPKPAPSNPYASDVEGRLSFAIPDNAATTDYYLAYARILDAQGNYWGSVTQDYSARNTDGPDVRYTRLDLSQPGSFYRMLPLSDAGRNGQRLTFSGDVRAYYGSYYSSQTPPKPAFIEIIVSSVPVETYDFYLSVNRYYDTDGNPFAEPAPLRSNLKPGYGLFGGATDVRLRLPL